MKKVEQGNVMQASTKEDLAMGETNQKKGPAFLGLSVLRAMGVSNPNRGEDGSPKSVMFGGGKRMRWSSQAEMACAENLLRTDPRFAEVRKYFQEDLTMKIAESVAGKLVTLGVDSKQAEEWAAEFDSVVFRKSSNSKKNQAKDQAKKEIDGEVLKNLAAAIFEAKGSFDEKELKVKVPKGGAFSEKSLADLTEAVVVCGAEQEEAVKMVADFYKNRGGEPIGKPALFRISQSELNWIASKILETKSGTFGVSQDRAIDMLNEMLSQKRSDGLLSELLGRMNACTSYQQDGKMYITHAIGTAPSEAEDDYFTGFDRLADGRNAAHIGSKEFSAPVMYQCYVIEMRNLFDGYILSEDIKRKIVSMVIRVLMDAVPQGCHAKMFSNTEVSYANAIAWDANPRTLVNAFQENDDARLSAAIEALKQHTKNMLTSYADDGGAKQIAEFSFGQDSTVKFANEVANVFI